jgi:mono/diheme cytochrome c family protein
MVTGPGQAGAALDRKLMDLWYFGEIGTRFGRVLLKKGDNSGRLRTPDGRLVAGYFVGVRAREPMIRGILLGVVLGVAGVAASVYLYFATGHAPVAVTASDMPFERTFARLALHSYLDKLPHPEPQAPADEKNMLEGAKVYKQNCAVCHGLPDAEKTAIAQGMSPEPPQLFKGTGVTDDEPWESYWKVEGGIRMSGMPGFKDHLTETQIWQVVQLAKNADKIPPAVKAELAGAPAAKAAPSTPPTAVRK